MTFAPHHKKNPKIQKKFQKTIPKYRKVCYNSILEELLLADLDNSGSVDSTDVFYILLGVAQNAVGMDSGWTPAQEKAADIDGSGAVDSTDVFYVLLYIARNSAGIPTTWEMLVA